MIKPSRLLIALLGLGALAWCARPVRLCRGFLPDNTMRIPVSPFQISSGLDEAGFNRVLDRVQALYGPIVAAHGGHLVINRRWDDPTVNASANRNWVWGNDWTINMYGGLARHPAMTEAGFALVACHELGHHLGGMPKVAGPIMRLLHLGAWAVDEGGADYFATLKCMRQVVPTADGDVDALAAAACDASFPGADGRRACRAGALAGQAVALVFQTLEKSPKAPTFGATDSSVVAATYHGHPHPQCRLDTYFQGALCAKPFSEEVSETDPNPGACTRLQGFGVGLRPLCWYKPPASEPVGPSVASRLSPDLGRRVGERLRTLGAELQGLQ